MTPIGIFGRKIRVNELLVLENIVLIVRFLHTILTKTTVVSLIYFRSLFNFFNNLFPLEANPADP